jgi:uncharacterized membrane protein
MTTQFWNSEGALRVIGPGHVIFAAGTAGIAVLTLIYGDFGLQWQPLPQGIPGRPMLAYATGAVVLAASIGVFFPRSALLSALLLALYQLIWVLTRGAQVEPNPLSVGSWLGLCEALALLIGGWILFALLLRRARASDTTFIAGYRSMLTARLLFGFCCLGFGLSHFAYADFTASMIPHWLPGPLWWAYLTGACHIAAGLGLLCSILPGLAATLEALMLSAFVLLVHVPSLVASPPLDWAPTSRLQWTPLFIACALAGSAWLLASSQRSKAAVKRGPP